MSRKEEILGYCGESNYKPFNVEACTAIKAIEWADQHPRKGLWDSKKVIDWVKKTFSETDKRFNENYSDMLIKCLCKAMEE